MRLRKLAAILFAIIPISVFAQPVKVSNIGVVYNVLGEKPNTLYVLAGRFNNSIVLAYNLSNVQYNSTTGKYYYVNEANPSQIGYLIGLSNTIKNTTVLVLTGTNTASHRIYIPYYNQITSASLVVGFLNKSTTKVNLTVTLNGNTLGTITLPSGSGTYTFANVQGDLVINGVNVITYSSTGAVNVTNVTISYTHTPNVYKVGNISGYYFDGLNDYIATQPYNSLNITNITACFWLYYTGSGKSTEAVFDKGSYKFGSKYTSVGDLTGLVQTNNGWYTASTNVPATSVANKPLFICMEYKSGSMKVYFNTTVKSELTGVTGYLLPNNYWLNIGGDGLGYYNLYGVIGDIQIYGKYLPEPLIKAMYFLTRQGISKPIDLDGISEFTVNSVKYDKGYYLVNVSLKLPSDSYHHYVYAPSGITISKYLVYGYFTDSYGNKYIVYNVSGYNTATLTLKIPSSLAISSPNMIAFKYGNKIIVAGRNDYLSNAEIQITNNIKEVYYNSTKPVKNYVDKNGNVTIQLNGTDILIPSGIYVNPIQNATITVYKKTRDYVEFTASGQKDTPVYFYIHGLVPNAYYSLYVDGKLINRYATNDNGVLRIGWDRWSNHHFVIKFAYAETSLIRKQQGVYKPLNISYLVAAILIMFTIFMYFALRQS